MWEFDRKSKFKKQYKLLGSVRQERVKKALMQLADFERPESLGVYKPSMKVYAYVIKRLRKFKSHNIRDFYYQKVISSLPESFS